MYACVLFLLFFLGSNTQDVPLTDQGIEEALEAGRRIRDLPVDVIYVSDLMRAQMTAMIAMTQHVREKVPVVIHNESEEASERSKIYSDEVAGWSNGGIRLSIFPLRLDAHGNSNVYFLKIPSAYFATFLQIKLFQSSRHGSSMKGSTGLYKA